MILKHLRASLNLWWLAIRLILKFLNPFGPFFLDSILLNLWKGMTAAGAADQDPELEELLENAVPNGRNSGEGSVSSSGSRKRSVLDRSITPNVGSLGSVSGSQV